VSPGRLNASVFMLDHLPSLNRGVPDGELAARVDNPIRTDVVEVAVRDRIQASLVMLSPDQAEALAGALLDLAKIARARGGT
jgi:hypothetical protein